MFLPNEFDPCQSLARRWLRAGHLVEHRLAPTPLYDDHWVVQAVAYRSARAACRGETDHLRLAGSMPAIAQAHALRRADPPLLRWATEARVVANEPFEDIGRKCALL